MTWAKYIGIQWVAGAQGPETYDCWSFFRHIQKEHFLIDTPPIIAANVNDANELVNLFAKHKERAKWIKIDKPEHGCAVIVHKPMHIGIWLGDDGGGVLHCMRGAGVCFTKDRVWQISGFGRRDFFKHISQ